MKTISIKQKIDQIRPELIKELGISNVMALPRITKVVVNSGVGKAKDKKRNELVANRIAKITGQKPAMRGAKQSIATFKVRQGDIVGVSVTLRGDRMYAFLDKLINVAVPRMRDFRGLNIESVDEIGNLTLGFKEHVIFPETSDEEIKDVFGFAISIVTTAKTKKEAQALFRLLGFPFKK
jgi:large subunit ribosomal protein L5